MFYKDAEQFKELSGYVIDGNWYPRVTKIIEIKSKPALYFYYAAAPSYAAAQEQTKKSAEEGTLIHETIEKIMVGENPAVDQSIAPAVEACAKFLEERRIQVDPANVERRIFNPQHRYAGTIDTLAMIDGKFGVLDIKTSQSIYRDYNLQTSAYMDALVRDPLLAGLNTRWILRIDQQKTCNLCNATLRPKGGRDKVRPVKPGRRMCPEDQHEWSDLKGII
ncbi:MAG: hypothetical protein AAB646_03160, partial [Patescibacteria group bacterium]